MAIKMILIGLIGYLLLACLLMKANMNYWNNYYKIYPEDLVHSDEAQFAAIKEAQQKKRGRKRA